MRENYKKFKQTSFYNEYKIIPFILILLDVVFVSAIIISLTMNRDIPGRVAPRFAVLVSVLGIIVTLIAFFLFYRFAVVPASKIEYIKEKYSIEISDKNSKYYDYLEQTFDAIDKIMGQEYSGKLLQKQTELEAMKNQINPHFLYNTLDTIRGYASIENAPITGSMIEILSRMFRYTVSSKQERVTISQEIGIVREYIKIQEYRTNVKIQLIENIDEDVQTDEYYVPKMILQPLIENSIKHGIPEDASEFIIELHIYKTQSRLVVEIKDSGVGMTTDTVARLNQAFMSNVMDDKTMNGGLSKKGGTGIGLLNINRRVKLMFGAEYGLYCYSAYGEGAVFEISLPVR